MTKSTHQTAANRLQEVSNTVKADFYLQINGDEPLIDTGAIQAAIPESVPQDIEFGTNIITKIHNPALALDPSNIKVTFDNEMNALYMSRTPIPYPFKSINFDYYKHVGIIGYNKKMLDFYANSVPGRLSVDTEQDLEEVRKLILKTGN